MKRPGHNLTPKTPKKFKSSRAPPSQSTFFRGVRGVAGGIAGAWAGAGVAAATGQLEMAPALVYGGAALGASLGFGRSVSQRKNMKAVNKLVNKSAMKITGKVKVKRNKKVKVSGYLKKAIKQTLVNNSAVGTFNLATQGYVGYGLGAADLEIAGSQNMNSTLTAAFMPGVSGSNGQRCLYNQLFTFGNVATTAITHTELNFFTPAKILHAASILFNNKPITSSPYLDTGNLSTAFISATGAPVTNAHQNLKIDVLNSYVHFSLKNCSDRIVMVDIWELGTTLKFQDTNPLKSMILVEDSTSFTATENRTYLAVDAGGVAINSCLDPFIDPVKEMQKVGYKFKGRKRSMVLAPDETCVHSIQGPKGMLDYSKLIADNILKVDKHVKNWSVGCIISVRPDQVAKISTTDTGSRSIVYVDGTNSGIMRLPISVEMFESYKIAVPEVAGFVTTAGLAGSLQLLNNRKHKHITFNACADHNPVAVGSYGVSNEENPVAGAVTGQFA